MIESKAPEGQAENSSSTGSPLDDLCVGEWGSLSRRDFAKLSIGAGASIAAYAASGQVLQPGPIHLPADAPGLSFYESDVDITTPDGTCDAAYIRPVGGAHPGVILWPDAPSLRESLRFYGRRLAAAGYSVVIPNIYYRAFRAPVWAGPINNSPEFLAKLLSGMKTTSVQAYNTDAHALMAFMESQPEVSKDKKMGTVGYCMGGQPALRTCAWFADRIAAAGLFHPGHIVTKDPDSAHLSIPQMKSRFYIAIAETDDKQSPDLKNTLRKAFADAHLAATIEVYAGTAHAWTIPDLPPMPVSGDETPSFDGRGHYYQPAHMVYDPAQAERAFGHLLALYQSAFA